VSDKILEIKKIFRINSCVYAFDINEKSDISTRNHSYTLIDFQAFLDFVSIFTDVIE
jgi:hypothetical protein